MVAPANNLLSDVMKRPAFLPERVLARAAATSEPEPANCPVIIDSFGSPSATYRYGGDTNINGVDILSAIVYFTYPTNIIGTSTWDFAGYTQYQPVSDLSSPPVPGSWSALAVINHPDPPGYNSETYNLTITIGGEQCRYTLSREPGF
jgi:hypothetical protein